LSTSPDPSSSLLAGRVALTSIDACTHAAHTQSDAFIVFNLFQTKDQNRLALVEAEDTMW